ncbi:hypothetical protein Golomagni_05920 [Golovinomyces magnicellulatus]|nr:hypothetical protein Golomagni_05920 [Golovinomyces magnicellulatus]
MTIREESRIKEVLQMRAEMMELMTLMRGSVINNRVSEKPPQTMPAPESTPHNEEVIDLQEL